MTWTKEKKKEYMREYRLKNKNKCREYLENYRKKNPDKIKAWSKNNNDKAMKVYYERKQQYDSLSQKEKTQALLEATKKILNDFRTKKDDPDKYIRHKERLEHLQTDTHDE